MTYAADHLNTQNERHILWSKLILDDNSCKMHCMFMLQGRKSRIGDVFWLFQVHGPLQFYTVYLCDDIIYSKWCFFKAVFSFYKTPCTQIK